MLLLEIVAFTLLYFVTMYSIGWFVLPKALMLLGLWKPKKKWRRVVTWKKAEGHDQHHCNELDCRRR